MNEIKRRDVLRVFQWVLASIGSVALVGPIIAFFYPSKLEEIPADPVLVGKAADIPPGADKTISYGRYPALVIHTSQGLRGYSAVCTHFGCIVKWDPERDQIVCPCHEGYFSPIDGEVIFGPPPTPLQGLKIEVIGDEIYLVGQA